MRRNGKGKEKVKLTRPDLALLAGPLFARRAERVDQRSVDRESQPERGLFCRITFYQVHTAFTAGAWFV